MKYLNLSILVCLIGLTFSCEKKDTINPTISIENPKSSDTFSVGSNSVPVKITIKDDVELASYSYLMKDEENNKYWQKFEFTTKKEIVIDEPVSSFGGFSGLKKITLSVQAYDKNNNFIEDKRVFHIQP